MAFTRVHSSEEYTAMESSKFKRHSLLRKLIPQKASNDDLERRSTLSHSSSLDPSQTAIPTPWRLPPAPGIREPLSSNEILTQFTNLHSQIVVHVRRFYSTEGADQRISQAVIEHASTGINLPWPQISSLLCDKYNRLAMLALCISWTVLSRTLLLKLGTSNSPGSTFLPPEFVECFQSFSLKGAVTLGKDETSSVNFGMLSCWKQLTAALSHSTYVTDAFSVFDPRTVNIERALKDLDPLLSAYAVPHDTAHGKHARLDDLRTVLRQGAMFAFTLFSQPSFWAFDWRSDRAAEHGKTGGELDPQRTSSISSIGMPAATSVRLTVKEIVVWPALARAMDGEGVKLNWDDEGVLVGEKRYMSDFEDT